MTYLSKELKKYYEKKNNKLLFQNKMSLNNLALEMWEKANYAGIDQSSLSRIVSGKRLFTINQMKDFCDILKLNKTQEGDLYLALQEDYLKRYNLNFNYSSNNPIDIVDILNFNLKQIKIIREHGLLHLADDWIENLLQIASSYFIKEKNRLRKDQLKSILANIYYEKGYISGCVYLPEKNLNIIKPIVFKIENFAKELKSIDLNIKANIVLSFAYYALGKYSKINKFKKFYLKSLSIIKKGIDKSLKYDELNLICWRTVAINSIYLSDQSLFKKSEESIREIIRKNKENPNFSYIIWAFDTIARGQSFFKNKEALDTLYETKEFNRRIKWHDPLREASMLRNEIEIIDNLKPANYSRYIIKKAKRGIIIATNHGFLRYEKLFGHFLTKYSNSIL